MFLKGDKKPGSVGEIDEYKGIEIEWKRGKKAILTIFDDEGKQIEDVKLYELKTRPENAKGQHWIGASGSSYRICLGEPLSKMAT